MRQNRSFASDSTLIRIVLPKFIFPGEIRNEKLNGLIASAERQQNRDEFDFLLKYMTERIKFAAKDQEEFHTAELCQAAAKLMAEKNIIGVLVVRRCCQYRSGETVRNLDAIQKILTCIRHLGVVYLISCQGMVEELVVAAGQPGRLVLIQVPDASVREDMTLLDKY